MERFRFYLDGTLVENPKGWDSATLRLEKDKEITGLFTKYSSELTFIGTGYDIIKQKYKDDGFCAKIVTEILYNCDGTNYKRLFRGFIFVIDATFNLPKCQVKAVIEDDSFSGRIIINKNVKAYLGVGISKGEKIIQEVPLTVLSFELYGVGILFRNTYHAYDAFRFLVDYYTDGEMDFISDYLSTGEAKEVYISTGGLLSNTSSETPLISFRDLFVEINKKYNIGMSIGRNGTRPFIRIEHKSWFLNTAEVVNLGAPLEAEQSFDTSAMYAIVKIGASQFGDPTLITNPYPEQLRYINWVEEEYNVLGDCNIDTTLDLISSWIIDLNTIRDITLNSNTAYNKDIVLICSNDGVTVANGQPWGVGTMQVFNESLLNSNVLIRWLQFVPNSIAAFLGNGNDTFNAQRLSNTAIVANYSELPGQFNDEIADPNNNYTPAVTFEYKIPVSGMYIFKCALELTNMDVSNPGACTATVKIKRYDSFGLAGGNLLDERVKNFTIDVDTFECLLNTDFFYCDSADEVITEFTINNFVTGTINSNSYFRCTTAITGGGIFQTYDPEEYPVLKYKFQFPIPFEDFNDITIDTNKLITFIVKQAKYRGWPDLISYEVKTGLTTFELTSKEKIT